MKDAARMLDKDLTRKLKMHIEGADKKDHTNCIAFVIRMLKALGLRVTRDEIFGCVEGWFDEYKASVIADQWKKQWQKFS